MNLAHPTPRAEEANGRSETDPLSAAFARWQSELLGTLYHLVGNADDARDALQETFLKCWRHRDEVGGVENLKAWDSFGSRSIQVATCAGPLGAAAADPLAEDGLMLVSRHAPTEDPFERAEQLDQLRDAVHDLRLEEQDVFLLRQNGELTYDDIAAALGIPLGTVKTRMRLALGRLRDVLASTDH